MKVKSMVVAVILAGLLCLTGCDVSGKITDTLTGEGIEGVRVSIVTANDSASGGGQRLYSTTTNINGEYRMSSFLVRSKSRNILAVRFSKEGYAFEPEVMPVRLNADNKAVVNCEGMPLK